jgi:hypothetical protein
MEDDRAGMLMLPLVLLNGDLEFDDDADEDAFLASTSGMIPTCIAGIHEFWKSRSQTPAADVRRSRRRETVGDDNNTGYEAQARGPTVRTKPVFASPDVA